MPKKVTTTDIAAKVGVSQGLVSLALSDSDLVNQNTKAEIILTALEMGYDLDKCKIRNTRDKIFSLVVSDLSYVNTFFWTEVIVSIENTLAKNKIGLDLVVYNEHTNSDKFLLDLIDKKTSGLIVIASCSHKRAKALAKSGLPMVIVDGDFYTGTEYDSISASNYFSAFSTAKYLMRKGHTNIGFVGSILSAVSFRQRLDGFIAGADTKEGITVHKIIGNGNKEYVTFNKEELLSAVNSDNPPTALMCANDFTATAVYDVLCSIGKRVPDDISIIGFDDISFDHELMPKITTNRVDRAMLGKMAVEMLAERISDKKQPSRHIELCCPLIERKTVKSIK